MTENPSNAVNNQDLALYERFNEEITALKDENWVMQEHLNSFYSTIGKAEWQELGILGKGTNLAALKSISETLVDYADSNALFKRGFDLRVAYCFSEGVYFHNLDDPKGNGKRKRIALKEKYTIKSNLMSTEAYAKYIKARGTQGNVFFMVNRATQEIISLPLAEVESVLFDTEDSTRPKFLVRSWTSNNIPYRACYRLSTNEDTKSRPPADMLGTDTPFDSKWVVFWQRNNLQVGYDFGVPDVVAGLKWAEGYSEYLENSAKLVRAYQRIATKVTSNSPKTANQAAQVVNMAANSDHYGSTAVMGTNSNVQHMPATGSTVSFTNGQPLASSVAAVFGVSDVALLASPSQGGNNTVAETLDILTLAVMRIVQADFKVLAEEILRYLGVDDIEIEFPTMAKDPVYRRLQSLAQAYATGAIFQEEYRTAVVELLDIMHSMNGLPVPDNFNTGHTPGDEEPASGEDIPDPIPSQGNSGATGEGIGSNNDARDNGEYDSAG